MGFFILSLLSARDLDIGPEGFGPRDDISRRLMTRAHEKGHVLIYLSHILPGQITCYCPRKMLFPRRQITRRKWCFYYTCKFGVISIKYVINNIILKKMYVNKIILLWWLRVYTYTVTTYVYIILVLMSLSWKVLILFFRVDLSREVRDWSNWERVVWTSLWRDRRSAFNIFH